MRDCRLWHLIAIRRPYRLRASDTIAASVPLKSAISRLALLACLFCIGASAHAQSCPVTPESDALRQIVQCLGGQDCRRRTVVETGNLGAGCDNQIEVWSWHSNRRSVTIRDRKMCLSRRKAVPDAGFVHGLLMPMQPVCGVEDPQLYAPGSAFESLWRDAWDAARAKLPENQITLAINPPTLRSQTHLHIHIVRSNSQTFPPADTFMVDRLDEVWRAADAFARGKPAMAGRNYGIAVRKRGLRFEVLVEAGAPVNLRNPEDKYSVYED